ncbi:ornithine-acyl[acyl carrier protein] N-acyltransferase [Hasllibacter halocynthiae]|uniref:L-ornithine N(alpha)-acyltransferase n=1 Tax=Hasllibacter halocynthiae TaxID=595589 RepID=A0A2T0X7H5_9RHOB|nr:GNAT family N-acyltransferase [Hasllibacter halocynthiae]PRY94900.1 ornithine-acyl[acyl carrier protein] N-acyltransferase [Hasllibacter halocynthiae]
MRYRVRHAETEADLALALGLRAARFRAGGDDRDRFDGICTHVLIDDAEGPACTFRLLPLADGGEVGRSYAAQHYDLKALERFDAPMLELGRFCTRGGEANADLLRVAWGELARIVDETGAGMLFGCSSFAGTEAAAHADALALLAERHQAPARWRPLRRATEVLRLPRRKPDPRSAMKAMPPLLRTYTAMGGWVSDHAVVDRDLGTLHVFTGLEIGSIPPARARALRGLAMS